MHFGAAVQPVARLAMHERKVYFEYDGAFIRSGLEISPFHLPLQAGLSRFDAGLFENLPGVFNDSLPDGWGRLLFDRHARASGIAVPDVQLFPARHSAGYFAIKRFDRDGTRRCHMHTACGLLHSDFRTPSLDYEDLIALTSQLARDIREVEKMYRPPMS